MPKSIVVMSKRKVERLRIICKPSALGNGIPGTIAGFIAHGKVIQKVPMMKFTPYMQKLFDAGYVITDKKPVHRLVAFKRGLIKSCPKKNIFDILPDHAIFTFERFIK